MTALETLDEYGYDYEDDMCRPLTRDNIKWAVADEEWQEERVKLRGWPIVDKIEFLGEWYLMYVKLLPAKEDIRLKRWVQVTNYLNALKRGGLLV